MKRNYEFEATGFWPFPWDMLRYDEAYPADIYASSALECVAGYKTEAGKTTVRLIGNKMTRERWQSFGWAIEPLSEDAKYSALMEGWYKPA